MSFVKGYIVLKAWFLNLIKFEKLKALNEYIIILKAKIFCN